MLMPRYSEDNIRRTTTFVLSYTCVYVYVTAALTSLYACAAYMFVLMSLVKTSPYKMFKNSFSGGHTSQLLLPILGGRQCFYVRD